MNDAKNHPHVSLERGRKSARVWLKNATLHQIYSLLQHIGIIEREFVHWALSVDSYPSWLPVRPYNDSGSSYFLYGFWEEVASIYGARVRHLGDVRYQQGQTDGRKWASTSATTEEIQKVKNELDNPYSLVWAELLDWRYDNEEETELKGRTPGHEIVALIKGTVYSLDDDDLETFNPFDPSFFAFWDSLLEHPIPRVGFSTIPIISHRIQHHRYALGFLAGASQVEACTLQDLDTFESLEVIRLMINDQS